MLVLWTVSCQVLCHWFEWMYHTHILTLEGSHTQSLFFVGWCWWGWKWVFRLRYEWTEPWKKWRWFPCSDSKLPVLLFGLKLFMVVQISDPRSRLWIASWLASAQMGFLTLLSLIWIICFSHLLGRTSISAIMSRVNKGIIYLLLLLFIIIIIIIIIKKYGSLCKRFYR